MPYIEQSDLEGLVPPEWLAQGLDDIGQGQVTAFEAVRTTAERAINGRLSAVYATPFVFDDNNTGLRDAIWEITVCLAVEALYIRRQVVIDKDSLLFKRIARATDRLDALAHRKDPLSPAMKPVNTPGVVIGEDSRVYSESLAA